MHLPFYQVNGDVEQLLVIEMAMPSVTTASVILARYHADEEYGVMHTLVTNMVVLDTVPIIVLLGGMLL